MECYECAKNLNRRNFRCDNYSRRYRILSASLASPICSTSNELPLTTWLTVGAELFTPAWSGVSMQSMVLQMSIIRIENDH